jgi:hypothetical protein
VVFVGMLGKIGVQDHDHGNTRTLEGDFVALFASAAYGMYTTAIKIKVSDVLTRVVHAGLLSNQRKCDVVVVNRLFLLLTLFGYA